ncbi:hypothetical protein DL98DRAFT_458528 [Cadophora sp. DSE1049]|nr:hypothetical protein DL98DRAFT_458528 [Cadophora sp. DSE1049]
MPPQRHLPPSSLPKIRQRGSKACGPCRKRKIKCDGKEPCTGCSVYGYDCVYIDARAQRNTSSTARSISRSSPTEVRAPEPDPKNSTASGSYMVSESIVYCPYGNPLLHQSLKTRFTTADSAIAHPRNLGIALGMENPPRLQSFGWNTGTRVEPRATTQRSICEIITLDQLNQYATVYFNEIHQFFAIFNQDMFKTQCADSWFSRKLGGDFQALICSVVILGSYFSGSESCPAEAEVAEHGRVLLENSTAHAPALLSMKHVAAWVLRAFYLRSTTRPHLSWMASCAAVHIAEAIGLHREINESQMRRDTPREVTPLEIDARRRTLWVTMAQHHFFASEYGRTAVPLDTTGCQSLQPRDGDFTADLVAIMQSIPTAVQAGSTLENVETLMKASSISAKAPLLSLLRADACFCIFRKLRSANIALSLAAISSLLDAIRIALDGVTFLCSMRQPWWNIVGTPFHSICVLLAIETSESFSMVPLAMETLKKATTQFDSHLSREALRTSHSLVSAAREKRSRDMSRDLESFDKGLRILGELSQNQEESTVTNSKDSLEWLTDTDLGFTDLLDLGNYYAMEL